MTEKELALEWQHFTDNIRKATPAQIKESPEDHSARMKRLEGDREEWIKYYFYKYAFSAPAKFQTESSDHVFATYDEMKEKGFGKFYQCRAWFRGSAKSTRRMMELFYLIFAKKFTANVLLLSKSKDNAIKLLKPYRGNLEANQRIIQDYGKQQGFSTWQAEEFTTGKGVSFYAVGRDQSPRGSKDEELRVNIIIFDDIDDDMLVKNEDLLDDAWDWVEGAVIPCVEISRPYFIFFDNNIYAEDQLALRAQAFASDISIVDLTDSKGNSTWPEKNTPEIIKLMLDNLSLAAQQREYYNTATNTGKTFPEIKWGACPPLDTVPFLVTYADPAQSNKDQPGQKSNLTNSRKAEFLIAPKDGNYYIYYGFLDVMSNARFMEGLYDIRNYIAIKGAAALAAYFFIENNTLQDPFYEQVILPLTNELGSQYGGVLPLTPDLRKKPEKWPRIEATLEPINRMGHLIFNIEEKDNPHMQRLALQFKTAKPTSKQLDGPDAIEGGVYIIKEKLVTFADATIFSQPRTRHPRKHG